MVSPIIDFIHSVLGDLALLKNTRSLKTGELKYFLTGLKTFLLCAKMLGADAQLRFDGSDAPSEGTLGSLLVRIGQEISRCARKLQPFRGSGFEDGSSGLEDLSMILFYFRTHVRSFVKEIDQWYTTLSDSLHLHQSSSPTMDDVAEIIDSVFQNLVDLQGLDSDAASILLDHIEAMEEKIKLFGNFIRFVAMPSVEHQQLQNFVVHSATVAINAAHVTALAQHYFVYREESKPNLSKVFTVLRMIKPFDTRVFEIYRAALASTKSSRELQYSRTLPLDHDPSIIMRDCIDFLMWILWETQLLNSSLVVSKEHQLQLLWERLKTFRTILAEQPKEFDEKIRDLSRVLICDAGVIIFSLYQNDAQMNLGIPDFLKKIQMILAEFEGKVPETSIFGMPKLVFLGFLNYLSDSLMQLKSSKIDSNTQCRIETIRKDLRSILDVLVELQNQQGDFQSLWDLAKPVASKIKSFIDQLVLEDIQDSCSTSLDFITKDIMTFKAHHALEISLCRTNEVEDENVPWKTTEVPPQNSPSATDEVVGFKEETESIILGLTRGTSKKRKEIIIGGMPGSGKTTLATKIYNHPKIMHHFPVRSCCSVSQVYNEKKLLLELLNHILPKLPDDDYLEMSESDMAQKLRRSLKRRRYLLFLDDVWGNKAWDSLKGYLPDDSNGSRILLTSRLFELAPGVIIPDEDTHILRQLTNDETYELLLKRLFLNGQCPEDFCELGKQIAHNCKGLPLMVVIVAGLLSTLELDFWEEVLKSLSSGSISSKGQCYDTFELSYRHLPSYLKPCFLYFGLFPEDQEVSWKELAWLWTAEGIVHKTELESSEDVATHYLMDLVRRNLVIVSKKGSKGGVKACRIHDLLHDFCKTKAQEENFFQLLNGYGKILAFNEWYYHPQRLCIHSRKRDLRKLRLFHPNIHSLLFFAHNDPWSDGANDVSFIISVFKHIRVLNMRQIDLGDVFPGEMELLVELRYLAVTGSELRIPPFIGNLLNLEIFIVHSTIVGTLPNTIWNLHKLRRLCIPDGFRFSVENLDNSSGLHKLESCSTVIIDSWDSSEELMSKFPEVCKLKCRVFQSQDGNKILISKSLGKIKSLHVSMFEVEERSPREVEDAEFEFNVPPNLTKLTLKGFELPHCGISAIGKLRNLQVLKLLNVYFCGGHFNMVEGDFLALRCLKLISTNVIRWSASDDNFPPLQKLVLKGCEDLAEFPSPENFVALETVEVLDSSHSIKRLVEKIKDAQQDLGNPAPKILISHSHQR